MKASASFYEYPTFTYRPRRIFSLVELKDIAISTLTLALAFTIWNVRNAIFRYPLEILRVFLLMLAAVTICFVLHELAHRYVAGRLSHRAEYRSWPPGLILAIVSSFLGFIFAAPGAVHVSGMMGRRDLGLISLAGPLTNLLLALMFKAFIKPLATVWGLGGFVSFLITINLWLGFFNLIPIPPLDGSKIISWSLVAWAIAMLLAIAILLI